MPKDAQSSRTRRLLVALALVMTIGSAAAPAAAHAGAHSAGLPDRVSVTSELADVSRSSVPVLMVFPQEPAVTQFDPSFGWLRSRGRRHLGVDLMAPKMSKVFAIADGVVTVAGESRRAGYYLVIEHTGAWAGWESWYVHLNNDTPGTDDGRGGPDHAFGPGIEVGVPVTAGQLVGYVGDSGNAEGTMPHTHFELHRRGRPIDPYPYLAPAHRRAMGTVWAELLQRTVGWAPDQLIRAASSRASTEAVSSSRGRFDLTETDSGVRVRGGRSATTQTAR